MKIIIVKNLDKTCSIIYPVQSIVDALITTTPNLLENISKEQADKSIARLLAEGAKLERIKPFFDGICLGGLTELEAINAIALKDIAEGLEYRITDISNIPSDRTFRNAWHDENPTKTVDIDLRKAKEIKKEQFRILREPLLKRLDIEYSKAEERNDNRLRLAIAAQRQALRDVTELELPNDLASLKSFIPSILA